MSDLRELYKEFLAADTSWSAELHRLFGKNAGTVRYTKKGEGVPGTALNAAYIAFTETGKAWREKAFASPTPELQTPSGVEGNRR